MKNRISITGPESTAKSWLSVNLAKHYNADYVEEFSREYLSDVSTYNQKDILNIAKGQLLKENKAAEKCNSLLFCDTDLLVNKIWSLYVFKNCDKWIEDKFISHKYGLYLLCYPDIEWESDPLRENPVNRDVLFDMYESELKKSECNYMVVKGFDNSRLVNAINIIDKYLLENKLL